MTPHVNSTDKPRVTRSHDMDKDELRFLPNYSALCGWIAIPKHSEPCVLGSTRDFDLTHSRVVQIQRFDQTHL